MRRKKKIQGILAMAMVMAKVMCMMMGYTAWSY
jgi:hypothetical protein